MSMETIITVLSSLVSAATAALISYFLTRKKQLAEIDKLKAETEKTRAEIEKIRLETEIATTITDAKQTNDLEPELELEDVLVCSSHETCYVQGLYCYEAKNYKKAILFFTRALELATDKKPEYFLARSKCYYALSNLPECLNDQSEVIQLAPNNDEYWCIRGNTYFHMANYQRAIDDYTRAIELSPKTPKYYACRGDAYQKMGELKKAKLDYSQAITLDPKNPYYYFRRGQCSNDTAAIDDYTEAIEIESTDF